MTNTCIKIFCVFFLLYFQSTSIIMAKAQTNVISEFKQTLLKNDKKLMRSYVTEGIELPTFLTDKHIHEIKIVPSPKEDTTILISYSKDTDDEFIISCILEIVTKNNKKALYSPHFDSAYELIFQQNGFQYIIAIGNKRYIKGKYNVKDLIQIAESIN
ncbi:hypothetical protein A6E21_22610 [Bacillus cereus]|nr:hypothetical protein A6E21_22610 [Bacillus cereus]